jgi:hypothetical protein
VCTVAAPWGAHVCAAGQEGGEGGRRGAWCRRRQTSCALALLSLLALLHGAPPSTVLSRLGLPRTLPSRTLLPPVREPTQE